MGVLQCTYVSINKNSFNLGRRLAAALLPKLFWKNPRPHHKGAAGRVQTGDQLLPVLCHCQLGQDIPFSLIESLTVLHESGSGAASALQKSWCSVRTCGNTPIRHFYCWCTWFSAVDTVGIVLVDALGVFLVDALSIALGFVFVKCLVYPCEGSCSWLCGDTNLVWKPYCSNSKKLEQLNLWSAVWSCWGQDRVDENHCFFSVNLEGGPLINFAKDFVYKTLRLTC